MGELCYIHCITPMTGEERATPRWLDLIWLLFLGSLALLPPVREVHKQIILLFIGAFQFLESPFIRRVPREGPLLSVVIKIVLATILMIHTSDVGINSSYYPIYYLPVTTAAMYFGPIGTLIWTALSSAAYCSYLIPALKQFELTPEGRGELMLHIVFFFLVAMIVNRFVMEYRGQSQRYQLLAENLSETNRVLKKTQDEARRAERLAALGQLAAGLAHEIRNPLGVIKGSAEILNQKLGAADALAKELSSYIYTEVNRLSALVSRFMDFARPSQLELRPQQLPALIERSLKSLAEQGVTNGIDIQRDYSPDLPAAMVDEELCEQVFNNLVLNACQAMGEKGGTLILRIRTDGGEERRGVVVEIEDTGPGIPPEMKEQIFNPFVTTKKSGVGLGLAIVTKIVDAHGGTVRVTSEPGHGACFQIVFPQVQPEMEADVH